MDSRVSEDMLYVITSHVYASFSFCMREGWFSAHRIHGTQTNDYLARGRLVETLYKRHGLRQIYLLGSVIDIVVDEKNDTKIVEVKASKSSMKRGTEQAKFLLYLLHRIGIDDATAEVTAPTSRETVRINGSPEMYAEVENKILLYYATSIGDLPPKADTSHCHACSYRLLCGDE